MLGLEARVPGEDIERCRLGAEKTLPDLVDFGFS